MSENISGQVADLVANAPPSNVNISATTNSTPIHVTTAAPHLLNTGESAVIFGHLLNVGANGTWQVTVTGASTLDLDMSVGTAVGGATGTVQSAALPQIPLVQDDDDFTAMSVQQSIVPLLDMVNFVWLNAGWSRVLYPGGSSVALSGSLSIWESGSTSTWAHGSTATFNGSAVFDTGSNVFFKGPVFFDNDTVTFTTSGIVLFQADGVTFDAGTTVTLGGTTNVSAGKKINFAGTAEAAFASGGFISGSPTLKGGSTFTIGDSTNATEVTFSAHSTLNMDGGSSAEFGGDFTVNGPLTDITLSAGADVKLSTSGVVRKVRTNPLAASGGWAVNKNRTWVTNTPNVASLTIPLDLLNGTTLNSVTVKFQGDVGGHTSVLPGTMPTLKVMKTTNNADTQLGTTTTDPSGSIAAFESPHSIIVILPTSPHVVIDNAANDYWLELTSEGTSGTGGVAGALFIEAFTSTSPASYDSGR